MVSLYRDFEESVRRVSGMLSAVQRLDVRPVRVERSRRASPRDRRSEPSENPTSMERSLIHGDNIP